MPVEVTGALELRKALQMYAPSLAKESQKGISEALKPIVRTARGFLPSNDNVPSGWLKREGAQGKWATRFYDQAVASRGVTFSASPTKANKSGFRSLATIYNKSAAGAIYETAGRKTGGQQGNSANPEAGQKFIEELNKTGQLRNADSGKRVGRHSRKQIGRVIFRAWAEDQGKANAAVIKAIENTNEMVKKLVDSGGGRIYKVEG